MEIKLFAFDLDGTLVDGASQISDENLAAVAAIQAAGREVILVTGRSWRGTQPFYDQLGLTGPAICYMGALAVDGTTRRILHHRPLAPAAWQAVRDLALAEQLSVTACVGADQAVAEGVLPAEGLIAGDTAYSTCEAEDFVTWKEWNPYSVMAPDLAPCQNPPTLLAVYGDRAVRRVYEAFPAGLPESQFDLTDRVAGRKVLHIWHEEVDKGRALANFCRSRGIKPEEVAAFGDQTMDISMITYAGLGVAMPDGDPALQAAARWVLPVPEAVRRILRGSDA